MTRTIDTLGKAIRHQMLLQVSCQPCQRKRLYETFGLATRFSLGRDPRSINFVCSRCGARCKKTLLEPRFLEPDTIVLRLDAGGWIEQRLGR